MIIIAAWRWTGVNIIYFSSGLVNVPKELYEAAAIDGASAWRMFRSITLPLIEPTILFVRRPLDHRRLPGLRGAAAAVVGRELPGQRRPVRGAAHLQDRVHLLRLRAGGGDGRRPGARSSSSSRSSSSGSSAAGGRRDDRRWSVIARGHRAQAPRWRVGRDRRRGLPTRLGLAVLFLILAFAVPPPALLDGAELVAAAVRDVRRPASTSAPTGLTLDNYSRLLAETPFARWFFNSVTQSLGYAALTVAICAMAGYALAKYRFRGRQR